MQWGVLFLKYNTVTKKVCLLLYTRNNQDIVFYFALLQPKFKRHETSWGTFFLAPIGSQGVAMSVYPYFLCLVIFNQLLQGALIKLFFPLFGTLSLSS